MKKFAILFIKTYKKIVSPIITQVFGNACRFTPTCSEYTIEALEKYGFVKGTLLGLKRLGKCHPFGGYGLDPVK